MGKNVKKRPVGGSRNSYLKYLKFICGANQLASGVNYEKHLLAGIGTRCCVIRYSIRQALTMRDICWRKQELDPV